MLIGVNYLDKDGNAGNQTYTYKATQEYAVGDVVNVPVGAKGMKEAVVTRLDVPESEVESFKDKIKTIGEEYAAEPTGNTEIDLQVDATLPVINTNFETIKANLKKNLAKYEKLVVTEETLQGCKQTQRELAGLRIKVDNYRKDKKKELSKPIEAFESECKKLIALIESVEKPIKDGINVFDDKTKEENWRKADDMCRDIAAKMGLTAKYTSQLVVLDKYTNLSAKDKDIKDDITTRAMVLKTEQDKEAELLEIITDTLESENKRLTVKMTMGEFQRYIDKGFKATEVIAEIKAQAERVYLAENPPIVEELVEVEETVTEPVETPQEATQEPVEVVSEAPPLYKVIFESMVVGTESEVKAYAALLNEKSNAYKVISQEQIDG